jgi:hypothetical protein
MKVEKKADAGKKTGQSKTDNDTEKAKASHKK